MALPALSRSPSPSLSLYLPHTHTSAQEGNRSLVVDTAGGLLVNLTLDGRERKQFKLSDVLDMAERAQGVVLRPWCLPHSSHTPSGSRLVVGTDKKGAKLRIAFAISQRPYEVWFESDADRQRFQDVVHTMQTEAPLGTNHFAVMGATRGNKFVAEVPAVDELGSAQQGAGPAEEEVADATPAEGDEVLDPTPAMTATTDSEEVADASSEEGAVGSAPTPAVAVTGSEDGPAAGDQVAPVPPPRAARPADGVTNPFAAMVGADAVGDAVPLAEGEGSITVVSFVDPMAEYVAAHFRVALSAHESLTLVRLGVSQPQLGRQLNPQSRARSP